MNKKKIGKVKIFPLLPDSSSGECVHFNECSGCTEKLTEIVPKIWEEVLSYFEGTVRPDLRTGSPFRWRHRAKIAVRGTSENPLLGLFRERSHDVVPIPRCLVHHPRLNQAFEEIRTGLISNGLQPYNEKTFGGDLRYLQAVVERRTGKVQMAFVLNFSPEKRERVQIWERLAEESAQKNPDLWHSLWLNFNDRPGNTIAGNEWKLAWGEEFLQEHFGNVAICYGPGSFGQANLPLFETMLTDIKNRIPADSRVVEYYAGVGAIGIFIAEKSRSVSCCEVNPFAERFFNRSRSMLSPEIASKLSFTTQSTQNSLHLLDGAGTVIVDPPRKGLDDSFFPALRENKSVSRLIYVSCGWESFKRDNERLCENGWKVEHVDGYLFFPGSNHIELSVNYTKA